jgi:hypothetical protein
LARFIYAFNYFQIFYFHCPLVMVRYLDSMARKTGPKVTLLA